MKIFATQRYVTGTGYCTAYVYVGNKPVWACTHHHTPRKVKGKRVNGATLAQRCADKALKLIIKQRTTCQLCGLDPEKKENKGCQLYVCDKCDALVCSECSEDGPNAGEVYCKPCDHERNLEEAEKNDVNRRDREVDRCVRCDAPISVTRAARFSVCVTCDPETEDLED
jgi:hypothetical protein